MWGFFSLGLVLVAGTIAWLLRRYAAPSVPYIVLATTAYAWTVSMSIVLITPLDVAATLMHEPEPAVSVFWKITYWSTQVRRGEGFVRVQGGGVCREALTRRAAASAAGRSRAGFMLQLLRKPATSCPLTSVQVFPPLPTSDVVALSRALVPLLCRVSVVLRRC